MTTRAAVIPISAEVLVGKDTWIFDIDDTLVNTTDFNERSVLAALSVLAKRKVHLNIDPDEARRRILETKIPWGTKFEVVLPELEARLGIHDPRTLAELNWAYDVEEMRHVQLVQGASKMLTFLRQKKFKMGIVTNGDVYRQYQKLFLTRTQDFFDEIVISGDKNVGVKKPDPAIFRIALDRLGKEPSKCVYVGDYPKLDMPGANAIGITSVRVRQGKHAGEEASNDFEKPTIQIHDLDELAQITPHILEPGG